jgi:hypothetical protein
MAIKKPKSAKKPVKAEAAPAGTPAPAVNYVVEVAVDKKGNFTYTAFGQDASTLTPNLGDTVSWSVRVNKKRVPFQVEFSEFGPFGYEHRVIRSAGKPSKPLKVKLPKRYDGNLVMGYRVTVPGAWSDDPDIVPPPSDGIDPRIPVERTIFLDTDENGTLTVDPEIQSLPPGQVAWAWRNNETQDDFVLTFETPQPGWPKNPTPSQHGRIVVALMKPAKDQQYTIDTAHSALQARGTLTIK